MKYNNILIDVSNLHARGYFVSKDSLTALIDNVEVSTGGIYNSIKMIQRIEKEFLNVNGKMYFIFDNHFSGENKRKLIDPEYKGNRIGKDKSYYTSIDFLHLILLNYKENYILVKRPGSEADDLVSPIIKNNPEDTYLLVSNDMDWFRTISEKVHVAKYEKQNYVIYTKDLFKDRFGFYPTEKSICLYKSFRGDGSDNIPKGVVGIRENVLQRIIEDFSELKDLFLSLDKLDYISDIWKDKIKESKPRLLLNMKLVSFDPISYKELKDYMFESSFSPRTLKALYKTLNFNISSFDPRILQYFPEKEGYSFFEYERIPRA